MQPHDTQFLRACGAQGHEGVVSKRKDARWRKIKTAAGRAENTKRWKTFLGA